MLPPSVDQVLGGLARYPEALAVIYTSPTYEGLCANTGAIAEAVHAASGHAILFVDEAWGGHLHFHPELPPSAMDGGADIAVQSTHKLAGGLQQTGLIHWREARVDSELMEEAFREYVTTSPSYHLLASADAAVRSLAATGRDALGVCIRRTEAFQALLAERLPRLRQLDAPGVLDRHREHVAGCDKVKTTIALTAYDISGFAVSEALVERGIVVEKAGVNTVTFITTFQLEEAAIDGDARGARGDPGRPRARRRTRPSGCPTTRSGRSTTVRSCTRTTRAATRSRSARRSRSTRPSAASRPRRSRSTRPASR